MYSTNMRPVTARLPLWSWALGDTERGHLKLFRLPGKLMAAIEEEEGLTSNRDFALVSRNVSVLATINTNSASVSLWTWKAGDDLHHSSGDLCTLHL